MTNSPLNGNYDSDWGDMQISDTFYQSCDARGLMTQRDMKKILLGVFILFAFVVMGLSVWLWTPTKTSQDDAQIRQDAKQYDVRIIRDHWGVPHIFGKTDADTSFGLGYAHAEDDWATIQDTLVAARGMTAQFKGKDSAPADYMFDLFKVKAFVDAKYETDLKSETRAIAKAYADAINFYAVENPEAVYPGLLPVTERDVVAGFTWATPFFYRLDGYLEDLFTAEDAPKVSPWQSTASLNLPEAVRGSNAFAVAPRRSDDGHTRLIINSHQPMTGPYAWYEAHVVSEEGLNLAGANFPGTPILTQGVTPHHGWAHTVNRPDLVDIYALETDREKKPKQYKLDGNWVDFERSYAKFRVHLFGPFSLPVTRDVLWSQHGPVLSTPTGHYAIKFAGLGNVRALEQWFEMSKVESLDDWKSVLSQQGVLSFNIVYADKNGNIGEVYNARMPKRIEGPDWQNVLPGDRSELIWTDIVPWSELPQIWNPESGFLFSANATPFKITDGNSNLSRTDFSETFGIETRMTNRARRALELFEGDTLITRDELLERRADTRYHPESQVMQMVVEIVGQKFEDAELTKAQEVLRNWDGDTQQGSRGTALAVITGTRALGYEYLTPERDVIEAFTQTATDLKRVFGRVDPEWGEVNRLQRGEIDVALDGAPDVLRAIYADRDGITKDGVMNAFAGDTHIMVADWDPLGNLDVQSISQYGSATLDKNSPHFSDQSPLFARGEYKRMPMTLEDVLPMAERDYRPGQ